MLDEPPASAREGALELDMRRRDLELRERALDLEKVKLRSGAIQEYLKAITASVAIIAAALTLIGIYSNGQQSLKLEERKYQQAVRLESRKLQSELIVKAVGVSKPEDARKNLIFFIKAGFLEDKDGKILSLATDPSSAPYFSFSSLPKEGYHISDHDMLEYCRMKYGSSSLVVRGSVCLDKGHERPIDFGAICRSRTGSLGFVYDPSVDVFRCRDENRMDPSQEVKER